MDTKEDQIRMQLLVLQLLQAKIRREITTTAARVANHSTISSMVQSTLSTYLSYIQQQQQQQESYDCCIRPACICMAALAVRTGRGPLDELMASLTTTIADVPPQDTMVWMTQQQQSRILAEIPLEIELLYPTSSTASSSSESSLRIAQLLAPYQNAVLTFIRHNLLQVQSESAAAKNYHHRWILLELYSILALQQWIRVGCISISQLYEYEHGTLWKLLLQKLSSSSSSNNHSIISCYSQGKRNEEEERIYVETARALECAVQIGSDTGTPSRQAAFASLFDPPPPPPPTTTTTTITTSSSSSSSVVAVAIQTTTHNGWDDAVVALSSFISTFVTEDIDDIITRSAEPILQLLILLQSHPIMSARIAILDCWLTVSEIPVQDRHEHWKTPLYETIATTLLETIQYTVDNVVDDEDEMEDYRNMVIDVLLVCYYLLRSSYVKFLGTRVISSTIHDAAKAEAALFCLAAIAPEVNGRVKTTTTTTMSFNSTQDEMNDDADTAAAALICKDCQTTVQFLLHVARHVCQASNQFTNLARDHRLTVGMARFLGAYSATWFISCSNEDILQLLLFLQRLVAATMSNDTDPTKLLNKVDEDRTAIIVEAANAVKSILTGCAEKLSSNQSFHEVLNCLQPLMELILQTDCEESMCAVAEGFTFFIVYAKSDEIAKRRALQAFLGFVVTKSDAVMNQLQNYPSMGSALSTQQKFLLESLGRYLKMLDVMIRFIDVPTEGIIPHPMEDIINIVWGFVDVIPQSTLATETIFAKILHIKQHLLRISPDMFAPFFDRTMQQVTEIFQANHYSCCLDYISVAVETFGSSYAEYFRDLLDHLTYNVFEVLRQNGIPDNNDLIQAFFQMTERFIVYSPTALIKCSKFATIVASAVKCLEDCRGECDTTLAILTFLSHLFGWRYLHASNEVATQLHEAARTLDELLSLHGQRTIQFCVTSLLGGSRALLPPCTDCIFTLLAMTVNWPVSGNPGATVARQWIETACNKSNPDKPHVNNMMINALLELAKSGSMSKQKARTLLSDFTLIYKGELSAAVLGSYYT